MSVRFFRNMLLLSGAFSMGLFAQAQQQQPVSSHPADIDLAITYVAERAKIVNTDCGCFWLQGGSGNFAFNFFHGLGVAGDLSGDHSADIASGVALDKVMFAAGPRYTFSPGSWSKHHLGASRELSFFGEALFGGVHGFNGVFPSSSGVQGAASSFAMQFGGGVNLRMTHTFGIRAIEADYVRSTLPNSGNDTQNDLRLGAGAYFHFGR
ncbi:hypothetical protein HNQ77_005428 [Silvibacterium bohemicum]|uniref:Outer membrane protein beta-barrel domain-containing protein n=1 Tax=Silvibacterium bohemicum TaxID=1577686 RepID=A0A841K1G7_9BACT|nr:hypothetical protein [Silvibacterium bohemicum]MBB6147432.1 hypothetical protein [Silvibacterium bohemicum]